MRRVSVFACGIALVFAAPAGAATLHTPPAGAVVMLGTCHDFDWRWNDSEYASSIVFTQSASPDDPIWLGGAKPGKIKLGTYDASNGRVCFESSTFIAGQWYWRTCSKDIFGEDDKCYYNGTEVRPITIIENPVMSRAEAIVELRKRIRAKYKPQLLAINGCSKSVTNVFDCSGRWRTKRKRCTASANVDNTGETVRVKIHGVRCKRIRR